MYVYTCCGGCCQAAALQVVVEGIGIAFGALCYLLYPCRYGRFDGVEGCLVGELVCAVACPVEREANETHCVTVVYAVLLII